MPIIFQEHSSWHAESVPFDRQNWLIKNFHFSLFSPENLPDWDALWGTRLSPRVLWRVKPSCRANSRLPRISRGLFCWLVSMTGEWKWSSSLIVILYFFFFSRLLLKKNTAVSLWGHCTALCLELNGKGGKKFHKMNSPAWSMPTKRFFCFKRETFVRHSLIAFLADAV